MKLNTTAEAIGPFANAPYYRFVLDGYEIPGLVGYFNEADNLWRLLVDGRFSITAPNDEYFGDWLWLYANGCAIAAGFTCHGKNSRRKEGYGTRLIGITSVATEGDTSDDDAPSGDADLPSAFAGWRPGQDGPDQDWGNGQR